MRYVSGYPALGTFCERNSCGLWNVTREYFVDKFEENIRESDDSPFKDYGIENDKMVKKHEFCLYSVADHVRVYLDWLYEGRFEELRGLYNEAIRDLKCRSDIYMMTFYKLKNLECWESVNNFMTEEFGNSWISYISAIHSVSSHISEHQTSMEKLVELQTKKFNGEIV